MSLRSRSDREILTNTKKLAGREREITVEILRHLIEIDRRELYLQLGYPSLFAYCTEHLRYSSSAAGRRVQAARCLRRFPQAAAKLANGSINLSTFTLVASALTETNAEGVLSSICGKSQREVEAIAATLGKPVRVRDRVRSIVAVVPAESPREESARALADERNEERTAGLTRSTRAGQHSRCGSESKPATMMPQQRIVKRLLVQFTASPEFMAKVERARALMSNRSGDLSFEAVFEVALNDFIERHCPKRRDERRRERKARKPQTDKTPKEGNSHHVHDKAAAELPSSKAPRSIPASVRDRVHARDSGRCTYVTASGRRCNATHNLQIDHIVPVARGGGGEIANLRLLCGKHNRLEAKRILGEEVAARFRRRQ